MMTEMRPRTTWEIAIALPAEVAPGDGPGVRQLGESRSRCVTPVLRCAVRARRQAAITRRLDELLADPTLTEQQPPRTAVQLEAVGPSWG
jgi:hypothetical protein